MPDEAAAERHDGVIVVTHDLYPYGAQRVTLALVESLVCDLGLPCEVVSLGGGELAVPVRRLAPVHMTGTVWKAQSRRLEPLLHAIARRGYRRAILNTVIAGMVAPPLRGLGFRSVGLVHEMPELMAREGLQRYLGSMLESCAAVVFPHESVRDRIATAFSELGGPARVECFPQGLIRGTVWRERVTEARAMVRRDLGIAPGAPLVLGVGLGDLRKGIDLFIECARALNEDLSTPCHFAWIGPFEDALKSRLAAEGRLASPTPAYLHLLGYREDTAPYHAAADVFALTSREDPFPNVVLESMDAGIPVVAFAGSGGGAHLAETVAGAVAPGFDPQRLARSIAELLGDPARRARLGEAAKARVDAEYAFRRYAERLIGLLEARQPATDLRAP